MGFTKYSEDNFEIIEERIFLHKKSDFQDYRFTQKTVSTIDLSDSVFPKDVKVPEKEMKRKDKRFFCIECGEAFLFKAGEQAFFEKHKLSDPKRCRTCRKKRNKKTKTVNKTKEDII